MSAAPSSDRPLVLAFDTATSVAVVAAGDRDGLLLAQDRWPAGHVHGERLLASVGRVLAATGAVLDDLGAIVVGIGPGSFTGLRVGLAVGKGLAFGLDIPLIGIATPVALVASLSRGAAASQARTLEVLLVLQPAGPSGRYHSLVTIGGDGSHELAEAPRFVMGAQGGAEKAAQVGPASPIALDLPEASAGARAAGELAREGLAAALLRLGTARLATERPDDARTIVAELVPTYVTLPRGASGAAGEIRWSHDRL